jgi:vacuolar-type H+-ATPase subunit I/STV1
MAEVEFGGMTFKGGKMFAILTALSTLGGALWGGFEFYKDYMDMKEIIQNIDIDAIQAANELQLQKLEDAIDYTRDIKDDLRGDILRVESVAEDASRRVKETQREIDDRLRLMEDLNRETEKDVRDTMRQTENRIEEDMRQLDKELKEVLQQALDNPLAD